MQRGVDSTEETCREVSNGVSTNTTYVIHVASVEHVFLVYRYVLMFFMNEANV